MTSTESSGTSRYTGQTQASTSNVKRQKATMTPRDGVSRTRASTYKKRLKPKAPEDQEFIRIITVTSKDTIIHNLRIPKHPPPSEIFPTHEDLIEAEETKKLQMMEAKQLCELSCAEADKIAQEVRQRTVNRAHQLMMEEEYEIRNLNSLIIGAKYDALNAAKMREDKELRQKFIKQEKELETMDNMTIKKYWDAIEDRERRQRQFRVDRRMCIVEQIEQNLERKKHEAELKRLEGQQIRQENAKRQQQIILDKKRKRVEDLRMHEENLRVNEIIMNKDKRRKEEKKADMIHVEQVRKNREKEDKYIKEQRKIKSARDKLYNETLRRCMNGRTSLFKTKKTEDDIEKNWVKYYHIKKAANVLEHAKKKLEHLKVSGLPDIYYHNVERGAGLYKQEELDLTNTDNIGQARMPRIPKMKTAQSWSYI